MQFSVIHFHGLDIRFSTLALLPVSTRDSSTVGLPCARQGAHQHPRRPPRPHRGLDNRNVSRRRQVSPGVKTAPRFEPLANMTHNTNFVLSHSVQSLLSADVPGGERLSACPMGTQERKSHDNSFRVGRWCVSSHFILLFF